VKVAHARGAAATKTVCELRVRTLTVVADLTWSYVNSIQTRSAALTPVAPLVAQCTSYPGRFTCTLQCGCESG